MVLCFFQKFCFGHHKSQNFFLSRNARNCFPEFNIRLYDKNSESDYFFSTKIRIFFSVTLGIRIFFRKKPQPGVGGIFVFYVLLGRGSITTNLLFTNKIRSYRHFSRPQTECHVQMYVHTFSGYLREIWNHSVINHVTCSVSSKRQEDIDDQMSK